MRIYPFHFRIACIAFILIMLFAGWEYDRSQAAVVDGPIPEEAIRLRILAHSDSVSDQWIKNQVRDAIIAYMEDRELETEDIASARKQMQARLPELERLVKDVLATHGFHYEHTVELGPTSFPAKMYGRTYYPAGEYEALRITIGEGQGRNWWCVLFPPLCFVDLTMNEPDVDDTTPDEDASDAGGSKEEHATVASAGEEEDIEMRFLLWDMLSGLKRWLAG